MDDVLLVSSDGCIADWIKQCRSYERERPEWKVVQTDGLHVRMAEPAGLE